MKRAVINALALVIIFNLGMPAWGAVQNTAPQLLFSSKYEIEGSIYSDYGRYQSGRSTYTPYETEDFTQHELAKGAGAGIPILITIIDPDIGQVVSATVELQGREYDLTWGGLFTGKLLAPTGSKVTGVCYLPLDEISNCLNSPITVTLREFENTGDVVPLTILTTTALLTVDRVAPVANLSTTANKIVVDTCNELPAKLMIQFKDGEGNWLSPKPYRILTTPSSFEYDSLVQPSRELRYWVEDMQGNSTVTRNATLATPNNKVNYIGSAEYSNTTSAIYVNTRSHTTLQIQARYLEFLGGFN